MFARQLKDSLGHARSREGLAQWRQTATGFEEGPEEVGIVHYRREQRPRQGLRGFARLWWLQSIAQRLDFAQAVAILRDRLPIPGSQLCLGGAIPRLRELEWILQMRAHHLAQALGVQQSQRHPATQRGVRARAGVAEQ